jgi:UDPglucose--hexose-1-phosphate uridylyltransferase
MKFEAIRKETVMLNPQKEMAERRIPSEIRVDPLTGRTARICHFMELQMGKAGFRCPGGRHRDLVSVLRRQGAGGDALLSAELIAEGRMQKADMVIFPNIAPYDSIGAVATFGSRHYIPMTDFTPTQMAAAFGFAMDFFRRVAATGHPESVYHIVNWNYMPPAGSSLIHPHLQVFSTSTAPNLMRQEIDASKVIHGDPCNHLLG